MDVTVKNKNYQKNAAGEKGLEYHKITPQEDHPPRYIPPEIGGSFFAQSASTFMGTFDFRNKLESLSTHQCIWQAVNRRFCSEATKIVRYGDSLIRPCHDGHHKVETETIGTTTFTVPKATAAKRTAREATEGDPAEKRARREDTEEEAAAAAAAAKAATTPAAPATAGESSSGETPKIPSTQDETSAGKQVKPPTSAIIAEEEEEYRIVAPVTKTARSHAYMEAAKWIQYDHPADQKQLVLSTNLDGYWPLSSQSNILRELTKEVHEPGFLPPGMPMQFRITRRDILDAVFENADTTSTLYFDDEASCPEAQKLHIHIHRVDIYYESLILDAKDLHEGKTRHYYVDVPKMVMQVVPGRLTQWSHVINLPKHTKVLILLFMHEAQIFGNKALHKQLNFRFRWPAEMTALKIGFEGTTTRDSLLFSDEMKELDAESYHQSLDCKILYDWLVKNNLYAGTFEDMFPENGNGYDNFLCYDLRAESPHLVKDINPLQLTLTAKNSGIDSHKYHLVAFTLQQYVIANKADQWTIDVVP